ncbi:hypothetical protein ALQ16_200970 [Pseudomonas syringae pv. actinidiae]|nr:hypothetical protein ALQ16_200970 [Pseudomonas syringae pv. actinidiae]
MGRITLEIPRRATPGTTTFFGGQTLRPVIGDQQLDRIDALKLGQQVLPALDLQHAEVAAGDVQYSQAEQAFVTEDGSDQVVSTFIQQGFIADGAGRDDPYNLTIHRAFAGGRVADLFADDHRLAQLHQLGQVALGRVIGNPAHGNALPGRLAAGGQGDVQQLGGFLGVFVEDFIEIAHAIKHQLIQVLVFEFPVLLHHRRMCGEVGNCFIHQWLRQVLEKSWATLRHDG